MSILLMLIPISLVLLGLAVAAFVWAVKRGQFDDLDTPALDILEDNDRPAPRHPAVASPADDAAATPPGDRPE
ncbi:cbb3-type cytochrome oxidase assembly protein CcoS [Pseudoxanthomonas jiangsuensis]|uniref:cbb3-type cytochrome oxidase assembly protein CcoS n=1 Tax=Pseudoxanthomonas jiangsuensis TaxID=619688 RepID=UPI0013911DFB|nr:cbb3-type cytochrome oxidase assembly protein CcoS [Pseudoxanthomonas jiangsuensis]KAF1694826.1 cbb3-type cytochrome oxidase assembly protein CcoS [Pseudoxanthomonas jiangsuensis]